MSVALYKTVHFKNYLCCIVESSCTNKVDVALIFRMQCSLLSFSVICLYVLEFCLDVTGDRQTVHNLQAFCFSWSIITCLYKMLINMVAVDCCYQSLELLMFCPKSMSFRYRIALFRHGFNCGSSIKLLIPPTWHEGPDSATISCRVDWTVLLHGFICCIIHKGACGGQECAQHWPEMLAIFEPH